MNCFSKALIKSFSAIIAFSFLSLSAFSQAYISSQIHSDKVSSILMAETALSEDSRFFSTDEQGFIIRWDDDNLGEHYQFSDFKIKLSAICPTKDGENLAAIYETDGKQNRVSVIDWNNLKRLYSIYYTETVSAIAFSEAGSFLIVGTYGAGETYIYKSRSGELVKQLDTVPGMISMIKSSSSEKSMIMYSSTGTLIYYDLVKFKQKARFSTERLLQQAVLFGTGDKTNSYLAGVRDNNIYIIDALSGKTLSTYASTKPLLCLSKSKAEEGLYFVYPSSGSYTVRLITNDTLKNIYEKTTRTITTTLVKTFTLKTKETVTAAAKNIDTLVLGTNYGNIYTISDSLDSDIKANCLTNDIYDKIYDAVFIGDDLYTLTSEGIYKTDYNEKSLTKIISNTNGWTNLSSYEDSLILWAKGYKKTVYQLNLESQTTKALFTPASSMQTVHFFENRLIYTQGRTTVSIYDFTNRTSRNVYTGSGVEDAVMVNNTDIYIAKAKTGNLDSALMKVNRVTMETVPLRIEGDLMLSINFDPDGEEKIIYGILITDNDKYESTSLAAYSIDEKTLVNLYTINEGDASNVFTAITDKAVFSNIGKEKVKGISRINFLQSLYEREYSIPVKVAGGNTRMIILNYNGSLSWYNKNSQILMGTWYLKKDGSWMEF